VHRRCLCGPVSHTCATASQQYRMRCVACTVVVYSGPVSRAPTMPRQAAWRRARAAASAVPAQCRARAQFPLHFHARRTHRPLERTLTQAPKHRRLVSGERRFPLHPACESHPTCSDCPGLHLATPALPLWTHVYKSYCTALATWMPPPRTAARRLPASYSVPIRMLLRLCAVSCHVRPVITLVDKRSPSLLATGIARSNRRGSRLGNQQATTRKGTDARWSRRAVASVPPCATPPCATPRRCHARRLNVALLCLAGPPSATALRSSVSFLSLAAPSSTSASVCWHKLACFQVAAIGSTTHARIGADLSSAYPQPDSTHRVARGRWHPTACRRKMRHAARQQHARLGRGRR